METRWLTVAHSYAFAESLGVLTDENSRQLRKVDEAASDRPRLDETTLGSMA